MTAYELIFNNLDNELWIYGETLERGLTPYKPSNVSRRCRELVNKGVLEKRFVKINGRNCVQYRKVR